MGEVGRVECVENVAFGACGFEEYCDAEEASVRGEEDGGGVVGVASIACIGDHMLAEDTIQKNRK